MNDVFGYIFKSLSTNEVVTKQVCKVVNNHGKALKLTTVCICSISIHMLLKTLEDAARDKKIAELKNEIEELKKKGEQSLCWTS